MGLNPVGVVAVEDRHDAAHAIGRFWEYPKLLSWLVVYAAGLPALPGVVFTRWDPQTEREVERFASAAGFQCLLLRSDSAAETSRAPRGGYLVSLGDLEREVRPYLEEGRAVFLLEPASPFDDLYSLIFEPDASWRGWWVDVVGAGFDASDLKRGDVTPHEQIRATFDRDGLAVQDRLIATSRVQAATRAVRFEKVARMLGCPTASVEPELRRRGETMLVDGAEYALIPDELLVIALSNAARLRPELARWGLDDRAVSISASFLGRGGRPVFWDVVWPRVKYTMSDV